MNNFIRRTNFFLINMVNDNKTSSNDLCTRGLITSMLHVLQSMLSNYIHIIMYMIYNF